MNMGSSSRNAVSYYKSSREVGMSPGLLLAMAAFVAANSLM